MRVQGPHLGQAHLDLNALSLHLMNALSHLTQQRLKGERMLKALSEGECKATFCFHLSVPRERLSLRSGF